MSNQPHLEALETRRFLSASPAVAALEPAGTAIVGGNVFTDANHNGLRDSNEAGRATVRVYLDYNNNGTRDGDAEPIAITNSLGSFRFDTARAPATMAVRLLLTGTNLTQTRPAGNAARTVTTAAGGNYEVESFGVAELTVTPPPATTAIIRGNVFYDTNQDAQRQSTEAGRANVRVYLDLNNDAKREAEEPSVLTNASGQYQFSNAPVRNDLHIRLDLTGTPLKQTVPTNNAARVLATVAGHTYVDQNFGVHEISVTPPPVATGTLRGVVFNDVNHDGNREEGDAGVPNRSVYIDLNHSGFRDAGDLVTTTDGEGRYTFTGLKAGTYAVRLYRGDLTQTSPANNGSNIATLGTGGTVGDLNFGTYPTPTTAVQVATTTTAVQKVESSASDVLA